jgi:hypothetical protein
MRASQRMLEPVRHARDQIEHIVRDRPGFSIGGLVLLALLAAIGIWAWPELRRTIHIHRM